MAAQAAIWVDDFHRYKCTQIVLSGANLERKRRGNGEVTF